MGSTDILTGDEARQLLKSNYLHANDEMWTPSYTDIKIMEWKLRPYLGAKQKEYNEIYPDYNPPFNSYQRQVAGFVYRGHRMICVYGFASSWHIPKHRFAQIFDANELVYELIYDVQTGQINGFGTEGPRGMLIP